MDFESIVSTIPPSRRVSNYNRKCGALARGRGEVFRGAGWLREVCKYATFTEVKEPGFSKMPELQKIEG